MQNEPPSPAFRLVPAEEDEDNAGRYIPAGNSPTNTRLEAPAVFRAPRPWYQRRKHNDWIEPIGEEEYTRRVAQGEHPGVEDPPEISEVVDQTEYEKATEEEDQPGDASVENIGAPEDPEAPEPQTPEAATEVEEETPDQAPEESGAEESEEDQEEESEDERVAAVREHLETHREEMVEALPEEPPPEEAAPTDRLVYAYFEGDYRLQQSTLSDVSEDRKATGDAYEIERKLLLELHDLRFGSDAED